MLRKIIYKGKIRISIYLNEVIFVNLIMVLKRVCLGCLKRLMYRLGYERECILYFGNFSFL